MKRVVVWTVACVCGAVAAVAEPIVSDIVVNQRWPWSEKVDVDFLLAGGGSDVKVEAVWDGRTEPYELGTVREACLGWNRLTWNPADSPFADKTLTGFSVSVTPVADNRYLIIDLVDGGVSYASAPNGFDGKWTDEYKTTKMVFRRIPAGTYYLGTESNMIAKAYGKPIGSGYATAWGRHDITFTSDFYVGVFKMTVGQYNQLTGSTLANPLRTKSLSYDEVRGSFAEGINWPTTGYEVSECSLVAKLRERAGPVDFNIDLCQECQWEAAMRAGTTTAWPNGGTMEDTLATWTNLVNAIGWFGTGAAVKDVGLKADNGWGIYDPVGILPDWTLDFAASTGSSTLPKKGLSSKSNPTGGVSTDPKKRVIRGSGDRNLYNMLPCVRQVTSNHLEVAAARFCIHLAPLVN